MAVVRTEAITASALPVCGFAQRLWPLLALVYVVVSAASLMPGSMKLPLAEIWRVLIGDSDSLVTGIVIELRLPCVGAAFIAGGLLAFAEVLMQMLLHDPPTDPYVLGVSGGEAVAAFTAMLSSLPWWLVQTSVDARTLLSMALVVVLARRYLWRGEPGEANARPLFDGMVMAPGWVGLIILILTMVPENKLCGMIFWMVGDFGDADRYMGALMTLVTVAVVVLPRAHSLNVLLTGETCTHVFEVPVVCVHALIHTVASLYTTVAVTTAGSIVFVDLLVPHMVRLARTRDVRVHLPATATAGGGLLMLADLIARTLIAPT